VLCRRWLCRTVIRGGVSVLRRKAFAIVLVNMVTILGVVSPAVSGVVSVAEPIVKDASRWSRWHDKFLYVLP
jgi:hypothetical protein